MINWFELFSAGLWIFGLALLLAILSLAGWEARQKSVPLSDLLAERGYRFGLSAAAGLVAGGLALSAGSTLEQVIWGLLGLVSIIFLLK